MARLKVYRTAIGFHDAYIATTSQKAALEAWGSDKNLFAFGGAEVVTDPKLTAEPLASPGKVIRRTRGSLHEHLSAAAKQAAPKAKKRGAASEAPAPRRTPAARGRELKPRPSREKLDEAEAAIAAFEAEAEAEAAEFERREAELREARKAAAARRRKALEKLEKTREQAKARYDRAVERWRATD